MKKFATASVSIVPVRSEASDASEIVTQLLFGESCEVLEYHEKGNWVRISAVYDKYVGWIDPKQVTIITSTEPGEEPTDKGQRVFAGTAYFDNKYKPLVLGALLPQLNSEGQGLLGRDKFQFEGSLANYKTSDLKEVATTYLGSPYLWGGKTPWGIDCSGLTQQVYKLCGITVARDASQQVLEGKEVRSLSEAQVGDLVFFENDKKRIHHVAMIYAPGQIIHAHGEVKISALDEKGALSDNGCDYTHHLHSIRRYV